MNDKQHSKYVQKVAAQIQSKFERDKLNTEQMANVSIAISAIFLESALSVVTYGTKENAEKLFQSIRNDVKGTKVNCKKPF